MKKYKITPNEYSQLIILYKNGFSLPKIAKKYQVSKRCISYIFKKLNLKMGKYVKNISKELTPEKKNSLITLYQSGYKIKELEKEFNFKYKSHVIRDFLKKNNIKLRSHNIEQRIYQIRENYFEKIDNEKKAYFLGLLYADGCNTRKNITISLSGEKDAELLKQFSKEIFINDRPLTKRSLHQHNKNHQDSYCLTICNQKIRKDLEKQGIVPNKSLLLKYPTNLPDHLFNHFLRGYFDGDGSIFLKNNKTIIFELLGTNDFLNVIRDKLEKHLKIRFVNNIYKTRSQIVELKTSKKIIVDKILKFLYDHATIYLERKYQKYKQWQERLNYERKISHN